MKTLTFYSQPHCQLCEDAIVQLKIAQEDADFALDTIDITLDDNLHELYALRVPVLMDDSIIIQEGNIDFVTVLQYLELI